MKSLKKIAILLATYNGEKYLNYLITSILNQTYQDFCIYIHDDGSTDKTIKIILKYQETYPEKIFYYDESPKHLGAKDSFFWLLEKTEASYYMFCDQDDFWLPFKIEYTLKKIQEIENKYINTPICIHTDLATTDSNFFITNKSLWKISKVKVKILEKKNFIQVFPCATGCTMLFNNLAKIKAMPFPKNVPMHDWWISLITVMNKGIIDHINKSTILYCQHDNNVVGANTISYKYYLNKISNIKNVFLQNRQKIAFLRSIGGHSDFSYWLYKIIYVIYRFF